jgi:hypothetical protein
MKIFKQGSMMQEHHQQPNEHEGGRQLERPPAHVFEMILKN